ncbi:MAG: hypothetical protein KBT46_01445 [Ruminococcus sp.]|nr:hypothetical protein [Candidatus Copronaster equi]
MKKILSVILSVVIALLVSVQTFAYTVDRDEFYPIVIVPGYSASGLYAINDDGTITNVWGLDFNLILKRVLARSIDLAKGIGKLTKGDAQYICDVVGEEFAQMFELMRCDENGSSVYDIHTCTSTAADSNGTYLLENNREQYIYEPEIMAMYGGYIGENYLDYIFSFSTDFRQGVTKCAENLNRYIDDVLEYTGAEKVNLYCISHGGQVGATFLNLYGESKADVLNNVILTEPAIGGATIAYDFFNGNIKFDEENLLYFIENGMMFETDYHWLVANENLDFLDDIINGLLPYFRNIMQYWGSLWDFIPAKYYDQFRNNYGVNPDSDLIKESDYFHYQVFPAMHEKLQACVDAGINVYILSGGGENDIAGLDCYSDAILPIEGCTGAEMAPYGERFNDGYRTLNTVCDNPEHNHLSPSMTMDLSTGYLPEYTWVVDGLYHGMTIKSDYCTDLITLLMFSDDRVDVHSYPDEFPQFHADTNRCQAVGAKFNNSVEGYVNSEDTALVVSNLSKKYSMRIVSVSCDGMNIDFEKTPFREIPAGESIEIPFTGNIPSVSRTTSSVTVNYILVGSVTPVGSRTLSFTIMNGDMPDYDTENPTVSTQKTNDTALNFILSFVESIGLQKIITLMYNMVKALIF